MKKHIASDNPFGPPAMNRAGWAYGFEFIADGMRVLDYGCYDGKFLDTLSSSRRVEAYGVDKDKDVVTRIAKSNIHYIEKALPFGNEGFDVVTLFDVVEHVYDQDYLLREVNRVLKKDGLVIITVPRRHLFSCLDLGNLKYHFPLIHRIFYTMRHSREAYLYRYVNNPYGLIGNVEKEKAWHQHFKEDEMKALLDRGGFDVIDVDGYGLVGELFNFLSCFGMGIFFTRKIRNWETWNFETRILLCAARKRGTASNREPGAHA